MAQLWRGIQTDEETQDPIRCGKCRQSGGGEGGGQRTGHSSQRRQGEEGLLGQKPGLQSRAQAGLCWARWVGYQGFHIWEEVFKNS